MMDHVQGATCIDIDDLGRGVGRRGVDVIMQLVETA
jgi:hypothetical protein